MASNTVLPKCVTFLMPPPRPNTSARTVDGKFLGILHEVHADIVCIYRRHAQVRPVEFQIVHHIEGPHPVEICETDSVIRNYQEWRSGLQEATVLPDCREVDHVGVLSRFEIE